MTVTDTTADDTAVGAEDSPAVRWVPSAVKEFGVIAYVTGVTGSYTLFWGDGASSEGAGGAGTLTHVYEGVGAYRLTARQNGDVVARGQAYVRAGLKPVVTFAASPTNPNVVQATIGDEPADMVSRYRFTWEPGGTPQEILLAKGDSVSHGFPAGEHTILVQDLHTGRGTADTVTVAEKIFDPDFTLAHGADVYTAELTLSVVGKVAEILVDWGDGVQDRIATPAVGSKISHTYPTVDNAYIVQAAYADGSGDPAAYIVHVPFPAAQGEADAR